MPATEFDISISDVMTRAMLFLTNLVNQKASDGEYTQEELERTKQEIEAIIEVIDYYLDLFDKACSTARSHTADKTSEKI